MEQIRMLVAIALSFLVFFVWQYFFIDKDAVQQKTTQEQPKAKIAKEAPAIKESTPTAASDLKTAQQVPPPLKAARTITIDAPLYKVSISEKGAIFKSFVLKDYREKVELDSALKELIPEEIKPGTLRIGFKGKSLPDLNDAVFTTETSLDFITVSGSPREINFSWTSPGGISVLKQYLFFPETYQIGLSVTINNQSGQTLKDNLTLSLINESTEGERYGFTGPSALINDDLEQVKIKKISDTPTHAGKLKWIAFQDRYFMSSIIPKTTTDAAMHLVLKTDNLVETQYVQPESEINSGEQQTFDYFVFLGPKSVKLLRSLDYDLDKAVNFGWFDFIAKPALWLMNFLYRYIPNYGLAIIILTILIKIILWPLGKKSYKSMNEMKKLQPIMAEIREKHKNDKQKMNQEVMALYKTYKINPLGGCLPMVAQIPVFFAFYRMLYEAIELRHAPFFGWINDLSAPDRLFSFDFTIPMMQPPYGIPVLTIVMGASMLLQQKMTPAAGDPTQQKMMMIMPVVFTVIFINFSSGLVLYWLVNNILSIAQQYYTLKKAA
ncbi:membrane protein insertase YidC [Thermodesulfobacteriota bacterium]